jgi:hypothetical protein
VIRILAAQASCGDYAVRIRFEHAGVCGVLADSGSLAAIGRRLRGSCATLRKRWPRLDVDGIESRWAAFAADAEAA